MCQDDAVYGITVNAFMSVSLKPPLVAVAIDKRANAHQTLLEVDRFAVSMLREDQEALSNLFAGYPSDAVAEYVDVDGMPLLDGALGQLVARITAAHEAGDHTIFVGQVEHLAYESGDPLLYYQGAYGRMETSPATAP
jgi:flavin reductase (DIM6/NTAB) family NADH-FMN oxidoreductase RutF